MCEEGLGVPQDDAHAVAWYRKAAGQGNAYAQTYLGLMYGDERGAPQDYAPAAAWFRKAADRGDVTAKSALGSVDIRFVGRD